MLFVFFLGFQFGLLVLLVHHRSIAWSATKLLDGIFLLFNNRRSSKDSSDSSDRLSVLIILLNEKTLSTVPFDAGRKNNSSTRSKALCQSDLLGALNNLHQTVRYSRVDKEIKWRNLISVNSQ